MVLYVLAYVACTIPAAIISFCQVLSSDWWISTNPVFYLVAADFMHASAIVNPLLYAWLNGNFRKQLLDLFLRTRWKPLVKRKVKDKPIKPQQVSPEGLPPSNPQTRSGSSNTVYVLQIICCCIPLSFSETTEQQLPSSPPESNPQRPRAFSFDTGIKLPYYHTPLEDANLPPAAAANTSFTRDVHKHLDVFMDKMQDKRVITTPKGFNFAKKRWSLPLSWHHHHNQYQRPVALFA